MKNITELIHIDGNTTAHAGFLRLNRYSQQLQKASTTTEANVLVKNSK